MSDAVFDLVSDAVLVVDENDKVVRVNASAERMFGYRGADIAGEPVARLFTALPPEILVATAGDPADREWHVEGRCSDGSPIPLEITVRRSATATARFTVLCVRHPQWVGSSAEGGAAIAARIGEFGYWSWQIDSDVVYLSKEALEILGAPPGAVSMTPATLAEHLHPDDRDEYLRAQADTIATGGRLDITHRVVAADGTGRVVRTVAELRSASASSPAEIRGVTYDVTEQHRVSEALRESENTLSAIVNSSTAMIYIKDPEGRYLLINRHFEEAFGVDNRTLRGKTDFEFLPQKTADSVRANDRGVLEVGRPVEFEETVPVRGEDHVYISIKFPLRRTNGEIYAVCGISTDITERKRAQAELESTKQQLEHLVEERTASLRETNRRLQQEIAEREETASQLQRLLDNTHEGVWVIDQNERTSFANPRLGEILGYEPSEMIGRAVYDFMPRERRKDAARDLERRRQGISEVLDFELQRKDGSTVWTLLSSGPVRDKDGNVIGALAMVTDISERKRAEESRALLIQELDHRVKNTLSTVIALSEMTMAASKDLAAFAGAFDGRIQAMARTHEVLARAKWESVSMEELTALVVAPLRTGDPSRVSAVGEPIPLPPAIITPLALSLNELGTNALKHGALSGERGTISIEWQRRDHGIFELTWRERYGPQRSSGRSDGAGLQLIRGLIEYELGGSLDLDFGAEGLVCRVRIAIPDTE